MKRLVLAVLGIVLGLARLAPAQDVKVADLGGGIYQALGVSVGASVRIPQSNTFMVVTPAGNVIIDTSLAAAAPSHKQALTTISAGPVRAIILTHAHGDHTGGIGVWRQADTEVIAHRNYPEFIEYTTRLAGYFARMNAAQFGGAVPAAAAASTPAIREGAPPTTLFDEKYTLTAGGTEFVLMHTPGETPDHLTVWMPKLKAAFIGDNFYESFPNIYTLRGTRPRWALDYVKSLDRVLALDPEIVLPSHGPAIRGRDEVRRQLTRYRNAILYVHDATVKGMNEGKDLVSLMRDIKLPPELAIGESYGRLTWSIRGIYEGYVGWFDGNASTMFGPASQAYTEIVTLAGGPDAVAARAAALSSIDPLNALYLTDMALAVDPRHRAALQARLAALNALDAASGNSNERGWLAASRRDTERRLK